MSDIRRLSNANLAAAAAGAAIPAYDRAAVTIGVAHLGPGAFHRAHQAAVIDRLLIEDQRWGICGVALKSAGVRDALAPQDGLYTLVELGPEVRYRIIGALKQVLVATEDADQVSALLASSQVRLITLTVTEKGYCLNASGALDRNHPDIVHDLARPLVPASAVGWLVAGLRRRRETGGGPVSVVSCDNLTDNGRKLEAATLALARAQNDQALADWIGEAVTFPNTMVDSITPATDAALRQRVAERIGLEDAWPIQRETFTQWVVEDRLAPGAPDLAAAGVILTADVRPFEQAKLRLLNGAHSTLAYLGWLVGLETIGEAMADPVLADFVERLMREDIAPSLKPAPQQDLAAYITAVLDRFRNPQIRHRLEQIAGDGSQKLPVRLLGTISDALAAGRPIGRLCAPIAAWILFVMRRVQAQKPLADPLASALQALGERQGDDDAEVVAAFLELEAVFPRPLAADPAFRQALARAYQRLASGSTAALKDL